MAASHNEMAEAVRAPSRQGTDGLAIQSELLKRIMQLENSVGKSDLRAKDFQIEIKKEFAYKTDIAVSEFLHDLRAKQKESLLNKHSNTLFIVVICVALIFLILKLSTDSEATKKDALSYQLLKSHANGWFKKELLPWDLATQKLSVSEMEERLKEKGREINFTEPFNKTNKYEKPPHFNRRKH